MSKPYIQNLLSQGYYPFSGFSKIGFLSYKKVLSITMKVFNNPMIYLSLIKSLRFPNSRFKFSGANKYVEGIGWGESSRY